MQPSGTPSWGSAPDYAANLTQDVGGIAPLATAYHGAQSGVDIQQVTSQLAGNGEGNLAKFGHFLGGLFSETGHLAEGAVSWLGKNALNMVEAPFKFGASIGHQIQDSMLLDSTMKQIQQASVQADNLTTLWKSGKITTAQYKESLNDNFNTLQDLRYRTESYQNMSKQDIGQTVRAGIDTVSAIVTVLTAGIGGAADAAITSAGIEPLAARSAADYLTSVNANAFLGSVEKGMSDLVKDPVSFGKLSPTAQYTLQHATAEVLAGKTATLTAGQTARAVATNVALKYPVYYNYLSTTGNQIYKELDQKKYGAAIRGVAFNAALMLSGGPIGWALKNGGKLASGTLARTFTRTAFIDELSKGIGDGDPAGLYSAIMKLSGSERAEAVKGLSAVEATNMSATGGNDPVVAAWRVLKGMANYEGLSMSQFTHEEALQNMVNFAKNQEIADAWGKKLGQPLTVGRLDVRAKTQIAKQLAESPVEFRAQTWEQVKLQNPNQAWANNENFDRQIKRLIGKYPEGEKLGQSIQDIKAAASVGGIPKRITDQMAQDGYVIIQPSKLEAPFQSGTGKLATSFADKNDDMFIKTVQPLPVLSDVGTLLTRLGLSPNASSQRVYQMFNDALSMNLGKTSAVFKGMIGESTGEQADTLVKKLSDYAHNPTRRGINKTPITDLRMMTTKDIQEALGTTSSTAKEVQNAISRAYMQVPLAVRGLGDRAVDVLYRSPGVGGVSKRFLRLQGAARFAWNPFFQYLRVIPKTEILATAEGGGVLRSIFQGNYGKLSEIRRGLREAGMFEEAGKLGNVVSGEATDFEGLTARNLTKKLLPMQERSIAGLVNSQAEKMGMSWQEYARAYPQNVRDTIQAIAQYDRRSNFLNSPLARTLNIAFFPFRFDAKVAGIMAKGLARTSMMTQVAVLNGLFQAHSWLNSPEGQVWYSKNASAIGIFNYITPASTFAEVFSALLPGGDRSLGNFGELGGLPFGWMPQLLDAEGLTHFNQAYVSPTTGNVMPDYIPTTLRGQAAVAIQDFITSLFSYPGATVGLPSKTSITSNLANGLMGASTTRDFTKVTSAISSQQQEFSNTIKAANGTLPTKPVAATPLQQTVNVPKQSSPLEVPKPKTTVPKKKKESQFAPQPLPGQAQLGQL